MTTQEWVSPKNARPHDGQRVSWLDSSGRQTDGVYHRGLWFIGDMGGMYIYYEPTLWKPVDPITARGPVCCGGTMRLTCDGGGIR